MAKAKDTASVLAFEKKLVPSDGYFYGTTWANKTEFTPLALQEKSLLGTISHRQKAAIKNDPAKLDAKVEDSNPQTVDACALNKNQDTLKHYFTLKILGGVAITIRPSKTVIRRPSRLISKKGFKELARRYAINIANARFLWRNRVGAEQIEVQVNVLNKDQEFTWIFDANKYSTRCFEYDDAQITELSEKIAHALSSVDGFLLLEITTHALVGKAQEVYPSEELIMDKGKGNKSKVLYQVNSQAAMHSQKIGNALRCIDTWYPGFNDEIRSAGPISIEPYGTVTKLGTAFRNPKEKEDFYTHFDKWAWGETLPEDEHYVMATLVRGGVFSERDK